MKVAVITGANKGIGYAIVKELCHKFEGIVYLTARNIERGEAAISLLKKLGLQPKFHQLDIDNQKSIDCFRNHLSDTYGGIDVLVNNAAIAYKVKATEPFGEQAENTVRVNYFALVNVCEALFPLLRPHARVVNVSSSAGHLYRIPSEELRKKLANPMLTISELSKLMQHFVESAKQGKHEQLGWPNRAYTVSKVGVSALSFIQQRAFYNDLREDIIVNAVHPGYVDTDMSSHMGDLTIEEGAEAPVYLALLPANVSAPKGCYVWHTKKIVQWNRELIL